MGKHLLIIITHHVWPVQGDVSEDSRQGVNMKDPQKMSNGTPL